MDHTSLRITLQEEENALTIKLEGRLAEPLVGELSRTWRSLASSLAHKALVIDLHDLISIDRAGIAVLGEIYGQSNAQFRADTPLTKYFAGEAVQSHINKKTTRGAI